MKNAAKIGMMIGHPKALISAPAADFHAAMMRPKAIRHIQSKGLM